MILDPDALPRHQVARHGPARKASPVATITGASRPTGLARFRRGLAWHRGAGHKRLTAQANGAKHPHL